MRRGGAYISLGEYILGTFVSVQEIRDAIDTLIAMSFPCCTLSRI